MIFINVPLVENTLTMGVIAEAALVTLTTIVGALLIFLMIEWISHMDGNGW